MSEHLGYDKHDPAGRNHGKSRHGVRSKTVLTEAAGQIDIDVPRDRHGTFEAQLVKKRQRRLSDVDEVVLSRRCMRKDWDLTITKTLGAQVYFCDSASPWQRGSNKNTNGLLSDYFPRGTDLSVHSPQHLLAVETELNNRPRKVLDHRTPAELFAALLASQDQSRPLRRWLEPTPSPGDQSSSVGDSWFDPRSTLAFDRPGWTSWAH